eukprot:COSAG02_NODE_5210_length_4540_cov_2.660662_1_plen_213_part_10
MRVKGKVPWFQIHDILWLLKGDDTAEISSFAAVAKLSAQRRRGHGRTSTHTIKNELTYGRYNVEGVELLAELSMNKEFVDIGEGVRNLTGTLMAQTDYPLQKVSGCEVMEQRHAGGHELFEFLRSLNILSAGDHSCCSFEEMTPPVGENVTHACNEKWCDADKTGTSLNDKLVAKVLNEWPVDKTTLVTIQPLFGGTNVQVAVGSSHATKICT